MKNRYWKFNRRGTWYVEDAVTGKQESLRTSDKEEAEQLRNAKNEATRDRALSLALGRAYLGAHDPKTAKRTWAEVMAEMSNHGQQTTQDRCQRVHRAYGKHAQVTLPSLEEYEQARSGRKMIPIRRQNSDAVRLSRVNIKPL